jgi:CDP-glucose 4,6-dehydratase
MDKIKNFYKNKRVFVTGHTGFKGSWLTNVLLSMNAKVAGYSKIDEKKKIYEKFCEYRKVKNNYGDITDFKKLKNSIKNFKPQIIFHLAAQALVSKSFTDPYETINANLVGTLNILEIIKDYKKIRSTVIITSDKCYFNQEINRGYKENDNLGGKDPYSASKAAAENIFFAYNDSFFKSQKNIGVATTRAGNVIGGGDWSKDRIVPDIVKSFILDKKLIIRNKNSTRPWQHVLEPISGYLLLGLKLYDKPKKYSESWNFGPKINETLKVSQIVKIFIENLKSKKKIKIVFSGKKKFKESKLLRLDSNKAKKKLGWKNKWGMKDSIKETSLWYKNYLSKKNMKDYSKLQIRKYFN